MSGHSWARPVTPDLLGVHEVRVDLAGDVAFQDAHDLAGGEPFVGATRDVFAGAFIAAHAREHDPPQRMVRLAVPAGVESVTDRSCLTMRARVRRHTDARTRLRFSVGAGCRPRRPTRSRRCGSRRRARRGDSARFVGRVHGCVGRGRRASASRSRTRRPSVRIASFVACITVLRRRAVTTPRCVRAGRPARPATVLAARRAR